MPRIGLLLPRSVDYPGMGFDIADALRLSLQEHGVTDATLLSENIGLGDDIAGTYARAEKLLMQDGADVIVAYANAQNAETLFPLAEAAGKAFIFLDAGVQFIPEARNPYCTHISLQTLSACYELGKRAGANEGNVLMAASFFDAGYRCTQTTSQGVEEAGGTIAGHFVSDHRVSDFTIAPYLELLRTSTAVTANFSIYLAELFWAALKEANATAKGIPMYCSPFMAEEQLLAKAVFPGGTYHTIVPWATTLQNSANLRFLEVLQKEKNKIANIFHLLGWEAGITAAHALKSGAQSLAGWQYESPRGAVTFHPETHMSYAPLYEGALVAGANGRCQLDISGEITVTANTHKHIYNQQQGDIVSGWRNNYFCA